MSPAAAAPDLRLVLVGVAPADARPACRVRCYHGVLSDAHVRAAARLAMHAHGFALDWEAVRTASAAEERLGRDLAAWVLPRRLPAMAAIVGPQPRRIPAMLALGYRQAQVLNDLSGGTAQTAREAGLLAAVFNAGISTIDGVVDSDDRRARALLDVLTPEMLHVVFTPGEAGKCALRDAAEAVAGQAEALAVALVASWAQLATELLGRTGNGAMWRRLGATLTALLVAEREVALAGREATEAATRRKSEGPSLAIAEMVALARRPEDPPAPALWQEAERLGRVFCLLDDLADLLQDARAGRPNVHLLRHEGFGRLSDPELYAAIDRGAGQLADLLAEPGPAGTYATELVVRWLRWDEHERALPLIRSRTPGTSAVARAAVRMLLARQSDGNRDAEHVLTVPRGSGHERHAGLLFQRAVILDALLDAFDAGLPVPWSALCREGVRLLIAKHPIARGGWSYLQSVRELPPDTDDLAQVVQPLARLGGRPLAAAANEAVRLVLDAAEMSGGIPTWILDPRAHAPGDRLLRDYVGVVGGGGVHPDVVANLVTALLLADPTRYERPVARATSYLAAAQETDGSWTSAWYSGPYYGTFRAAAALAGVTGHEEQRARARAFLGGRQKPEGGWEAGAAEPLSTALAVLGLRALDPEGGADAIERGVRRLAALQEADGGWPASAWIQFPTKDGVVTHGSRIATTAFALKAVLGGEPRQVDVPPAAG